MSAPSPRTGARVAEYRLGRELARGGTASVFECHREADGARLAIKLLSPGLAHNANSLARLLQEGRAIRALSHEHIVRVFDHGTTASGTGYVVMELLDGLALDQALAREGRLAPARAAFIGRQICDGLAAAHARQVFHRDIKPANIMLVEGQRHRDFVKLLDFGVARLAVDDPARMAQTAQGMTLGTPQYMSPEQAQALPIDGRSDLYNTGLVLYEMLVGAPPFDDGNPVQVMRRHLLEAPVPVRQHRPEVPAALERIVARCLEKDPALRFPSAEALSQALDHIARDSLSGGTVSTLVPGQVTTTADLQLPTLGNPGDLARYAASLQVVLEQLWPQADAPAGLLALQAELDRLADEAATLGEALQAQRAAADAVATAIEAALGPLERALSALELERVALENSQEDLAASAAAAAAAVAAHDARYAATYAVVEAHQAKLFQRAAHGAAVDFRDLYREDVEVQLAELDAIFNRRAAAAAALDAVQDRQARLFERLADVRLQIHELTRSRLRVEARREGELARLELAVTHLENRQRGLERAREHQALALGLAFRRAVSALIDARDGRETRVSLSGAGLADPAG